MSSFLMNSGYSGVDPGKFPGSPSESEYSQSSYLGSHSDYYSHMQTAAAAQHYGYGASAAAAMSGYPNPRDPMGYSNYYQQCSAMTPQQVRRPRIWFFGSVRSSRSGNLRPSVCPAFRPSSYNFQSSAPSDLQADLSAYVSFLLKDL